MVSIEKEKFFCKAYGLHHECEDCPAMQPCGNCKCSQIHVNFGGRKYPSFFSKLMDSLATICMVLLAAGIVYDFNSGVMQVLLIAFVVFVLLE